MNYKNATQILPQELLTQIQKYIDGEFIYIPRLSENKNPGEQPPQRNRNLRTEITIFTPTI